MFDKMVFDEGTVTWRVRDSEFHVWSALNSEQDRLSRSPPPSPNVQL